MGAAIACAGLGLVAVNDRGRRWAELSHGVR
jgi:hypothetical protein